MLSDFPPPPFSDTNCLPSPPPLALVQPWRTSVYFIQWGVELGNWPEVNKKYLLTSVQIPGGSWVFSYPRQLYQSDERKKTGQDEKWGDRFENAICCQDPPFSACSLPITPPNPPLCPHLPIPVDPPRTAETHITPLAIWSSRWQHTAMV